MLWGRDREKRKKRNRRRNALNQKLKIRSPGFLNRIRKFADNLPVNTGITDRFQGDRKRAKPRLRVVRGKNRVWNDISHIIKRETKRALPRGDNFRWVWDGGK